MPGTLTVSTVPHLAQYLFEVGQAQRPANRPGRRHQAEIGGLGQFSQLTCLRSPEDSCLQAGRLDVL